MSEALIVTGAVVVAAAYLVYRAIRQMRSKQAGCGCGAESCPQVAVDRGQTKSRSETV